jgi:uncharacterized protein (DUF1778 family)
LIEEAIVDCYNEEEQITGLFTMFAGQTQHLGCTYSGCTNRDMSQVQPASRRRINMRVSERQEQLLRAAAELSGETLTGFVLSVATERAEQVLERAHRIDLSSDAFQRFVAALDAPAEDMPVLRRYATEASPIARR